MPSPLVLLALLLPIDALLGGAAALPLVLAATALCAAQGSLLPEHLPQDAPPALRQHIRAMAAHLRHPAPALLESAGVIAAAFLTPPIAALLLASAALYALETRLRLAAQA